MGSRGSGRELILAAGRLLIPGRGTRGMVGIVRWLGRQDRADHGLFFEVGSGARSATFHERLELGIAVADPEWKGGEQGKWERAGPGKGTRGILGIWRRLGGKFGLIMGCFFEVGSGVRTATFQERLAPRRLLVSHSPWSPFQTRVGRTWRWALRQAGLTAGCFWRLGQAYGRPLFENAWHQGVS